MQPGEHTWHLRGCPVSRDAPGEPIQEAAVARELVERRSRTAQHRRVPGPAQGVTLRALGPPAAPAVGRSPRAALPPVRLLPVCPYPLGSTAVAPALLVPLTTFRSAGARHAVPASGLLFPAQDKAHQLPLANTNTLQPHYLADR